MQIVIRQLTKRYPGGKFALKEVDLDIHDGLFGLLGPNGAGKTTLMRILVTLLEPSAGEVFVDGMDLRKNRKAIRRMVGYLPQEFSTFSKLKVWEFLDFVGSLGGIRRRRSRLEKIDRLLDDVGLFDARDRIAGKLSGGMKRRLGIAQTLISDPRIMIVDEPTTGLDPEERVRFRNLLGDLSRKGMIILLSTHIVGDISSTCSHIALLDRGKIVFNGPPDGLIDTARGKVWKISAAFEELDALKIKYPVISVIPSVSGYEMRLVADEIDHPGAVAVNPNLEDAYVSYMKAFDTADPEGLAFTNRTEELRDHA